MDASNRITEFLSTEQVIYGKFRTPQSVQQKGLHLDTAIEKEIGGFAVVTQHPWLANNSLGSIAQRIKGLVPCYAYDKQTHHSTFCHHGEKGFRYKPAEHQSQLEELAEVVGSVITEVSLAQISECRVAYKRPIYNETSVILPGEASSAYVDLLLTLAERCQQVAYMQPSWGTHIAVARITEVVTPAAATLLFQYLDQPGDLVGNTQLRTLQIVRWEWHKTSLQYTIISRFNLE